MAKNRETYIKISIFVIDILCLILSLILASHLWIGGYLKSNVSFDNYYVLLVSYMVIVVFFNASKQFLQRSNAEELMNIVKTTALLLVITTVLLYFTKSSSEFSRGAFSLTCVCFVVLDYVVRSLFKRYLKRNKQSWMPKIMLITTSDQAARLIRSLNDYSNINMAIDRLVMLDLDYIGKMVESIPVVAKKDNMISYIKTNVVDEVLFYVSDPQEEWIIQSIEELESMGITIHVNIPICKALEEYNKRIGMIGAYPVVSFATNFFDSDKLMIKRLMDIAGALVGAAITIIIGIILTPFLLIESPGPLIFKQKRVGLNGRYFYIYKFRSMYMDAEERKKELMKQNEMKGLMFKMKDDPRVTKVGKFIRATSIDELPQFFNVLKGDMSLVGTRPPTVDEFKEYKGYHKRRLSIKPGITGMWQVSGRSDIEDFEEVVRLDLKYIDNWSLSLDIRLLIKTVVAVFKRAGAS